MSSKAMRDAVPLHHALGGHDNALNALRLLLATFVVVDHSFKAATGHPGPWSYMGGFAVDGFFAISGYLIAGSRVRTRTRMFFWRRALRLMPAYWTLLLFTAFVVAPLSTWISGRSYAWGSALGYVLNNSLLFTTQMGIDGTPAGVAYEGLWNASTWSLPFEAAAYVVFGLLLVMPQFRARSAALVCAGLAACVVVQYGLGVGGHMAPELARLWSFFAAGVLLWFLRERLPRSTAAGVIAFGSVAAMQFLERAWYLVLAPIPFAFLLLWLGARLPTRVGSRNDISYGVYLFAFPLQQLMAIRGVPAAVGPFWFAVLSVMVTVPVAWMSWIFIERPSLRLRWSVPALGRPVPGPPREPSTPARTT